jgi:hypothetical protein
VTLRQILQTARTEYDDVGVTEQPVEIVGGGIEEDENISLAFR